MDTEVPVGKTRTPIGKFIHTKWTGMNMRAGKYKHHSNKFSNKHKCYENITIEFTQPEFKQWCLEREKEILSLIKPSIDRIDNQQNYTLDNIQVIELSDNIKKRRKGNTYVNGPRSNKKRGVDVYRGKFRARLSIKGKEIYKKTFNNEEDAYNAFKEVYTQHYGKNPW